MQKFTRRQLLIWLAATGGTAALAGCGSDDPMPTVATEAPRVAVLATPTQLLSQIPTRTPSPTATLLPPATPTSFATVTQMATPIPTITPLPTLTPINEIIVNSILEVTDSAETSTPPKPIAIIPTMTSSPEPATPIPPTAVPPTAEPTLIAPTATAVPPTPVVPTPIPATPIPATPLPPTAVPPTATPTLVPSPTPEPCIDPGAPPPESGPPYIGLHASADPSILPEERCTFLDFRPSAIKVLTFHPADHIAKLAITQPSASWIVRTFLNFGGRTVTPEQFVEWTLSDTQRTLNVLAGRNVLIELHNEPNLYAEGLGASWANGWDFANWWLAVLAQYQAAIPNARFLYPGVSPGGDVVNVRQNHPAFMEESRAAIDAAYGLGMHLYWSADYSMQSALATLDEVIAKFPAKPIWITEASYNRDGLSDSERAQTYLNFIAAIKQRPTVEGLTFFVASASNAAFSAETWVGKTIAEQVGNR